MNPKIQTYSEKPSTFVRPAWNQFCAEERNKEYERSGIRKHSKFPIVIY